MSGGRDLRNAEGLVDDDVGGRAVRQQLVRGAGVVGAVGGVDRREVQRVGEVRHLGEHEGHRRVGWQVRVPLKFVVGVRVLEGQVELACAVEHVGDARVRVRVVGGREEDALVREEVVRRRRLGDGEVGVWVDVERGGVPVGQDGVVRGRHRVVVVVGEHGGGGGGGGASREASG